MKYFTSRFWLRSHGKLLVVTVQLVFIGAACGNPPAGQALYIKHCAPCHGPKGQPSEKIAKLMGVKNLTQSKLSEAEIERQIREGRREGNRQLMPPFKDIFKPDEIKALTVVVKEMRQK